MTSPDERRSNTDRKSHASSVPRKRPTSWNNYAPPSISAGSSNSSLNRLTKKRAPRACVSCRDRKVRCDVMSGGSPCTNCQLDNVECILKESNRGKHNSASHQARARTASLISEARPSSPTVAMDIEVDTTSVLSAAGSGSGGNSVSVTGCETETASQTQCRRDSRTQADGNEEAMCDDDDDKGHSEQQGTEARRQQPQSYTHQAQSATNPQPDSAISAPTRERQLQTRPTRSSIPQSATSALPTDPSTSEYLVALAFQDRERSETTAPRRHSSATGNANGAAYTPPTNGDLDESRCSLPPYIRPHPDHLDKEDIEYLRRKDCLTIPDDHLRDELIRIYVFVVHPFMPAVDLASFLEPITGSDSTSTVSLLLFQAIMFASVAFVDTQLLQSRGIESKRAARKVFFNRVKLLYSLDYEADRLTLVQALLLMTSWYDSDSDDKHTWYWMGIALTTAQVEGLHRDTEEAQNMTNVGRLRRRIWWSCVIRDRLLGLGIRRPSRIREDEFSVGALRLDDFDLSPPSPAAAQLLAAPSYTGPESSGREALATICIDLSKLCIIIGRILHSQYTIGSTMQGGSNYLRKAIVRPKSSKEQSDSFAQCDTALQDWFENRAPESRYVPGVRESRTAAQTDGSMVRLHQTLLYMNYLTALGALHRPQVFYSGSGSIDLARKADSRRKVTEAAVAITKLAFDLQSTKQMCYSPTSSIPAFLSAALIHILNTRSSDEETRNISIGRFCQCLDALHQLQSMYAAADQAVYIVNNVLENAGLMVPLLGIGNPTLKIDRATTGKRPGGSFNGIAPRSSRLFSEIWPSRVATAYPSPAPAISNDDGARNDTRIPAVAESPSGNGVAAAAEGFETQYARGQSAAGSGYNQFAMPTLMNMWSNQNHIHPDRNTPLPPDAMAGAQFHLDEWYDVGDILDPALMNFEIETDFVPSESMPM